jgi:hypothetical protein
MSQCAELCYVKVVVLRLKAKSRCILGLLFPHWLIVVGVLLAMFGFVGLAFHRNKQTNAASNELRPQSRGKGN